MTLRHGESRVRASPRPPTSQPGQTEHLWAVCPNMRHHRRAQPSPALPGPAVCWLSRHLNGSSQRRKSCMQGASRSRASRKGRRRDALWASGWAYSLLTSGTSSRGGFSPEQLQERKTTWLQATAQETFGKNNTVAFETCWIPWFLTPEKASHSPCCGLFWGSLRSPQTAFGFKTPDPLT